ncbi:MAG: hypothetical protein ACI4R9_04300 [Kiritimatiellia bacterium]
MKKLMIAAMGAATAGGLFAATVQVYDMTITVKSTECKDNKKVYSNVCADDIQFYRAQATQKFYGKFWGCGCETLCAPDSYGEPKSDKSFVFWGSNGAFHNADIDWPVLQLVGKNGTNIEGAFDLKLYTCDENGDANVDPDFNLSGAGYGTASVKACADEDNYVKSMSGNVVGIANVTSLSEITGCKYCGEYVDCQPWDFCDCVAANENVSAAFGTFTLKYNASQAKALAKGKWIDEANKFKSFVTDEFACIAAGDTPVTPVEPDAKEVAEKVYKEALAAKEAADKAVEDLRSTQTDPYGKKGTELQQAADDAATAAREAQTALTTAAQDVPNVAAAQDEVEQAEQDVEDAKEALATAVTQAEIAAAREALADAEQTLADAKQALTNAKNAVPAADKAKLTAYETALAKSQAADAAKDAADKALADWTTNDMDPDQAGIQTGYDIAYDAAWDAWDAADDALFLAKVQCAAAGAECK